MYTTKFLATLVAVLLCCITLSTISCKELGKQPPVTESIQLSTDGQSLIRTYSILNVTRYERKGGSTFRSGNMTRYFERIDPLTGHTLSNSGKFKENLTILFVSDKLIWYKKYNQEAKDFDIVAINAQDFTEFLSGKQLLEKNDGLRFNPHRAYRLKNNSAQIVLRGNDERYYTLDETTGKALLVAQDSVNLTMPEFLDNNWEIESYRYRFAGTGRRYLERRKRNEVLRTQEDFISPSVFGKKVNRDFLPISITTNWLVFSKTTNDNTGVWQINLLDTATLQTRWYTTMDFDKVNKKHDIESITLLKEGVLIICDKAVGLLDVKEGSWIWSRAYPDSEG